MFVDFYIHFRLRRTLGQTTLLTLSLPPSHMPWTAWSNMQGVWGANSSFQTRLMAIL